MYVRILKIQTNILVLKGMDYFLCLFLFSPPQSTLEFRHSILSEIVTLLLYIRDLEYFIYFSVKLSVVSYN